MSYHVSNTVGSTGTSLAAQGVINGTTTALGTRLVHVGGLAPLIVNTKAANPGPHIARDQCVTVAVASDAAYECGDLRLAEVLPATTTMNKARAPTLVYDSRHGVPIELIAANVSVTAPLGVTNLDVTVKILNNQTLTWSPGVTVTFPWSAANQNAAASRVVVPVDFRTQGISAAPRTGLTGLYVYTVQVSARSGATVVATAVDTSGVAVVDRSASQFGRGWWLDGLEQLVTSNVPPASVQLWIGGDGNARMYAQQGNSNVWIATPALDRPDTLTFSPDSLLWKRHLRNGAFVEFDNTGRHVMTQNAMATGSSLAAHQTRFTYTSGLLTEITLPVVSGTPPAYTFATKLDANGNMDTAAVTAPQNTGKPRMTILRSHVSTTKQLTITEADGSVVTFPYATSGLITSRVDPHGPHDDVRL